MKKVFLWFCVLIVFYSCKNDNVVINLKNINGYWEIKEVMSPEGNKKLYKFNEVIDYFELNKNKGFRKKVMPQLDGTYLTNDDSETIEVMDSASVFYIKYTTEFATWKEQIIEASDSVMVLKNNQNFEYFYKRHIPFSVK